MRVFAELETAEFQIVAFDFPGPPAAPGTQGRACLRFEFVGSGNGFCKEQRIGHADLLWKLATNDSPRLIGWEPIDEERAQSAHPLFADVSGTAFAGIPAYKQQFLPGVDHWRTILDGASGIDIYGHNGVAVGDVDGDDLDDIYICQPAGLPNRLWRNRGDGTFEDITESSGVGVLESTACALFADIDNDGRQDLIVVRNTGPMLFLNKGNARFEARPDAFRFANPPLGTFTGAAIADYDRDGWLDIYFCLYSYYQGNDLYRYPTPYYAAENGPPNFLMRNNRDATFRDVTRETRLDKNNTRFSFCCAWGDHNGDGWPDLYVVNDFGRKNLYKNNGDGTFSDVAAEAGVEDVGAGMSVCWFDAKNTGREDLYVADMWTAAGLRISNQPNFQSEGGDPIRQLYQRHAMGNSLYENLGEGKFRDTGNRSGALMGRWAWSSDSWDFDHDGFADLYVANGMISGPLRDDLNSFFWRQVVGNSPAAANPGRAYELGWNAVNELIRADATWSGYERNVMYRNNGDGTFTDVSGAAGLDFLEDSRTFALADFDGDGRFEILLKNRSGPQLRYFKNTIPDLPASISFRLAGRKSNRDAIGATVILETEATRQIRVVRAGSGFLAQHSKELLFGLGGAQGPCKATVRWPSGIVQHFENLPPNHRIFLEEGSKSVRAVAFSEYRAPDRAAPAMPQSVEDENLPETGETWLLAPVEAPELEGIETSSVRTPIAQKRGNPLLLYFSSPDSSSWRNELELLKARHGDWKKHGLSLIVVNVASTPKEGVSNTESAAAQWPFPVLNASADTVAVYNILYGRLFDRHRDMPLPTSFLLDPQGNIVKVYRGTIDAERFAADAGAIPKTPEQRLAKGLPFAGVKGDFEPGRNYLSLASMFFERGYPEQALVFFRLAARDEPDSAEVQYGLGSAYLKLDQPGQAKECFDRAVRAKSSFPPTLPNAWNNLGILAAREGRTDDAIALFQRALQIDADHSVALQNLGNAYRQKKDWANARKELTRSVDLNPDDPEANYGLGMVFAQTGDTQHAEAYLQNAIKVRPEYPEALNNLGILYLKTERPSDAEAMFQRCIEAAPAFEPAYLNLARLYEIQGDKEKARALLNRLIQLNPKHQQAAEELRRLGG